MKKNKTLIILIVLLFSAIVLNSKLESNCAVENLQLFSLVAIGILIGAIITNSITVFRNRK